MQQGPYDQYTIPNQIYPPPTKLEDKKKLKSGCKNTMIGCGGILFLIILIGSCNAVITGGKGIGSTATPQTSVLQKITSTPTLIPTKFATSIPTIAPTITPTPKPTIAPTQPLKLAPTPTMIPTPKPVPMQPPVATPTGIYGNPWGYDFTPGNKIINPPAQFCTYFLCVSSFWTSTNGYVAECVSGKFSHSGGAKGECSQNGGMKQILYSH